MFLLQTVLVICLHTNPKQKYTHMTIMEYLDDI